MLYEVCHSVHLRRGLIACATIHHEATVHYWGIGGTMHDAKSIIEGNCLVLRVICHLIFQIQSKTAQIYKIIIIK